MGPMAIEFNLNSSLRFAMLFSVVCIAMVSSLTVNYVHARGIDEPCTNDDDQIKVFHGRLTKELYESYDMPSPKILPSGDQHICLFPYQIPQLNISKSDYDSGLYDKKLPKECGLVVQENFGDGHICKPKLKMPDELHSSDPTANPSSDPSAPQDLIKILTYVVPALIVLAILGKFYKVIVGNKKKLDYGKRSGDDNDYSEYVNDGHDGEFRDNSKKSKDPIHPTYEDIENNFSRYDADMLEKLIVKLFNAQGHIAKQQGKATQSDGGIDVKAIRDENETFIQVKHYAGSGNPIRAREVRDFYGAITNVANKGIFITTSKFTKDAEEFANDSSRTKFISLWDIERLKQEVIESLIQGNYDSIKEEPEAKSDFNYYEILGVSKNATQEEIKNNFRKISKSSHPDVNPSSQSETFMKNVNIAYETLKDVNKRRQYDSELDSK